MNDASQRGDENDQVQGAPPRVLAVDDDPSLLHFYERALEASGYSVVIADSAEDALKTLDTEAFDVIVSDLWMPGKTGLDLLREVRLRNLDLPVIIVTAAPDLQTALRALDEGALRYLVKPVNAAQLTDAVRRAVALHRMSRLKRQALELMHQGGDAPGDRVSLRLSFDRAVSTMTLAYQPVVDSESRMVFGYEALLRPKHPAFTTPSELLVHPRDLLDDQLYDAKAPLSAQAPRVILEITERSLLEEVPSAHARIESLRQLGFRLAIDDLEVLLIAEGVETAEERDTLRELRCPLMQGYFFARPGAPFPKVSSG